MKKAFTILPLLALSATVGLAQGPEPTRQAPDNPTPNRTTDQPARGSNYGWIGLFGLIGLAGLGGRSKRVATDLEAQPRARRAA
jgi:MYXO-CTERM domain-containing protein